MVDDVRVNPKVHVRAHRALARMSYGTLQTRRLSRRDEKVVAIVLPVGKFPRDAQVGTTRIKLAQQVHVQIRVDAARVPRSHVPTNVRPRNVHQICSKISATPPLSGEGSAVVVRKEYGVKLLPRRQRSRGLFRKDAMFPHDDVVGEVLR